MVPPPKTSWHSTRTQFLHASAITADEHHNFQHLLHLDRRQLQLSRRHWLHGCTASYVRSRSRQIFSASLCGAFVTGTNTKWSMAFPRTNFRTTTATVLTATATATSSLRVCLCFSQDDDGGVLSTMSKRWTASRGDAEHEVPEPEDAHEEGKPCLICQATIWSRHDLSRHVSRCLFLSYTPSQVQQRRGYLALRHLHSALFSDRERGARTCCLLCSTSAND